MAKLSVTVLSDAAGNFYGPEGITLTISTDSQVLGITQVPGERAVPPYPAPMVDVLQVRDPILGTLYLLSTIAEYQAAAAQAAGNSNIKEINWTETGNTEFVVPAGNRLLSVGVRVDAGLTESISMGVVTSTDVLRLTTFDQHIWKGLFPLINYFSADTDTTVNVIGATRKVTYSILLAG